MTRPETLADAGFGALTAKIARERGFACGNYKESCLKRRIAVRMRARGVHRYADYAVVLDGDAAEYEKLLDALTINVTKLWRNPETWNAIERVVAPALLTRTDRPLRVWSAGCASGEEPYSIAMAFLNAAGTDVDARSLDAARTATYDEAAFVDMPAGMRDRWFEPGSPARVAAAVRALVTVERRDLLEQAPPPGPWHLIVCRNVIIYFDRASQERLFHQFHDALVPGGFLVLGKVETLFGEKRTLFTSVDSRERIFTRP